MGRPPLFLLRVHTSLSSETLRRMDKIVGEKGRSAFIRKAVDRYLDTIEEGEQMKAKRSKAEE
jgi:metal-responsive CopG/Arc/MetJ family transcriptional regulator